MSGFFALRESLAILAERVKGYFPTSLVTFLNKKSVISRFCYSFYKTPISKSVPDTVQNANETECNDLHLIKPYFIHSRTQKTYEVFKLTKCIILRKEGNFWIWWQQHVSTKLRQGRVYHCVASLLLKTVCKHLAAEETQRNAVPFLSDIIF